MMREGGRDREGERKIESYEREREGNRDRETDRVSERKGAVLFFSHFMYQYIYKHCQVCFWF